MTIVPERNGCGLPGGHIEGLEQPDDALRRELAEELGLQEGQYHDVRQYGFWRDKSGGRIILGYTGVLDDDTNIRVNPEEVADIVWVSYDDLANGVVSSKSYGDYLLELLHDTI